MKYVIIIGSGLIVLFMLFTPMGWKLSGVSFINATQKTNEIVYNGKVIAEVPKDCILRYTLDFEEVTTLCTDKEGNSITNVWIKGVFQKEETVQSFVSATDSS